jgi:hypothetical protein
VAAHLLPHPSPSSHHWLRRLGIPLLSLKSSTIAPATPPDPSHLHHDNHLRPVFLQLLRRVPLLLSQNDHHCVLVSKPASSWTTNALTATLLPPPRSPLFCDDDVFCRGVIPGTNRCSAGSTDSFCAVSPFICASPLLCDDDVPGSSAWYKLPLSDPTHSTVILYDDSTDSMRATTPCMHTNANEHLVDETASTILMPTTTIQHPCPTPSPVLPPSPALPRRSLTPASAVCPGVLLPDRTSYAATFLGLAPGRRRLPPWPRCSPTTTTAAAAQG